jgi:hypothetical protein
LGQWFPLLLFPAVVAMYSERPFAVLSIDGGGVRGILAAAVLASLERDTGTRITDHFDLVVGTSTGGIIALGGTARRWSASWRRRRCSGSRWSRSGCSSWAPRWLPLTGREGSIGADLSTGSVRRTSRRCSWQARARGRSPRPSTYRGGAAPTRCGPSATWGPRAATRSRPSTRPRRATRGDVCTGSPTLATILAGQGDADAAASVAGQMLDYAAGMESCRIDERILKVRDAVVAAGDGQTARELSERVWDMAGVPMRLRR